MKARRIIDDAFHYGNAEHAQYEEEGYCVFQRFLTPDGLAECGNEIGGMLERLQPGRAVDDIINAHEQEPWIWELAPQLAILDMIQRQVGGDIVFWSSHLISKPPKSGRRIPWHQDAPYWNMNAKLPCGVWIGFDDMDAYIAGAGFPAHRPGFLYHLIVPEPNFVGIQKCRHNCSEGRIGDQRADLVIDPPAVGELQYLRGILRNITALSGIEIPAVAVDFAREYSFRCRPQPLDPLIVQKFRSYQIAALMKLGNVGYGG